VPVAWVIIESGSRFSKYSQGLSAAFLSPETYERTVIKTWLSRFPFNSSHTLSARPRGALEPALVSNMSAIMSGNNFYSSDSHSPSKPASPTSPTVQFMNQSSAAPRSFINLTHSETRTSKPPLQMKQQITLMDQPPGMTYAEFIRTWTDSQVARWLTDIKCGCHDETFKANDIRGDVILELDQASLKEIGIASIGDRLRILNAVKSLRQRVASRNVTPPSIQTDTSALESDPTSKSEVSTNRSAIRRLEITRPAPLHLSANANRGDLPALIREQAPDSAKSAVHPMIRPLPQPNQSTPPSNGQLSTPNSSVHSVTPGLLRPNLPPLPPPPRGQPPLPPARNTARVPAYTSQPPPPTPPQNQGHLTPSGSWVNHHLPSDPRPGNPGGKTPIARSVSPVPPASLRPTIHGRNGSLTLNPPNNAPTSKLPSRPTANAHPYASAQPTLHPPTSTATHLSPIEESFSTQPVSSPPTLAYTVGRGPFNPTNSAHNTPYSLSDLRRKLVKFVLPDEGLSFTIDVATCNGGVEVLERVLKKFDKGSLRSDGNLDVSQTDDGGLTVDGWGVFMEMDIGSGKSFSSLGCFFFALLPVILQGSP
jgi:mitogen-activated protein kinase kinase kinase